VLSEQPSVRFGPTDVGQVGKLWFAGEAGDAAAVAADGLGFLLGALLGVGDTRTPDNVAAASLLELQVAAGADAERAQGKAEVVGLAAAARHAEVAFADEVGDSHSVDVVVVALGGVADFEVVVDGAGDGFGLGTGSVLRLGPATVSMASGSPSSSRTSCERTVVQSSFDCLQMSR